LQYDNEKERQCFIGKEKDLESGLADHGVRNKIKIAEFLSIHY
jgi:hypothetical protein